jgi:hypothetical protein
MDEDDYPTEETLKRISEWDWHDVHGLAEYVVDIWHYGDPWARLSDWRKDDIDQEYRELRLATGGWSGNESIVSALHDNRMFEAICWYLSQRGGLHIYHIPRAFK